MNVLVFQERGVYAFPGCVRAPLAGVGSRGDDMSNRLALDHGDSRVVIDRERGLITVRNTADYAEKTHVLDLLLQAEAVTDKGEVKPVAVHLKVTRHKGKLGVDLHRHLRTQDRLVDARFDPYDVLLYGRDEAHLLLTPERIRELILKPRFALLIVKYLMSMTDHLEDRPVDLTRPGPVVDLSMGFGIAGRDWMLVRSTLESLRGSNAELVASGAVDAMIREGAWRLKLTALSERWLPEVVIRDLFLFGLEALPNLAEVRERGLRKGQTLTFHVEDGHGQVLLDERAEPFPRVLDLARDYMEFHMLGGLIVERLMALSQRST